MKTKLFMMILLMSLLTIFTGCGTQSNKEDEITVVTTYKPATDIVLALSAKDQIVGVDDSSNKNPILIKLAPKHDIVGVGSKKVGINIETVLSLNPDVVILYPTSDDSIKTQLEAQGITVIKINPETMDSLQSDILTVGKAIGREKEAHSVLDYMNTTIQDVENRVKDVTIKKNVYIAGSSGVLSTNSGDFYQHEIITIAGGNDVSKDLTGGWVNVSLEQLLTWNPDVITPVNYCPDSVADILANAELANLNAIKSQQVFMFPSNIDSWDMPTPVSILSIIWMGKTLYPEQFTDVNLFDVANDFYQEFYGQSFEDLGGLLEG